MSNLLNYSSADLEDLLQRNLLKVEVENINPEKAQQYLLKNFSANRQITLTNVNNHVLTMNKGEWLISTDCIGFDRLGRLINGQHRLTAVVKSNTSQLFIVVRNLPVQSAQIIDLGKKRFMEERLCIAGKNISKFACAAVRNAMTTYTANNAGTSAYSEQRHDNLVYSVYEKHSEFFNTLEELKVCRQTIFAAAAAKMYAEMRFNNAKKGLSFDAVIHSHGMKPMDRAIHFIELALNGVSNCAVTDVSFDTAAIRLKELRDTRKAQNKHWSSIQEFRLSATAAYAFMHGKPLRVIKPAQKDPFRPFLSLPKTNIF